ncbi:MAG TPA: glycosyltransferase, partial [Pirellulales bacterium]
TGGGLLCEPENPADLAAKLRQYLLAPELIETHGRQGRQAIHASYAAPRMAQQHVDLYRQVLQPASSSQPVAEQA